MLSRGGGRCAYAPRRCSRKPRADWPLKGPRPECGMGFYQPRFLTVVSTMPILRFLTSPGPHGLFSSIGSTVTLGPNSLLYRGPGGCPMAPTLAPLMPFAIALARSSSTSRVCHAGDIKSLALIALLPVTRWRCCPNALASPSLPCCARHEGPDAVSALGGLLLQHCRRRSLVPVAMSSLPVTALLSRYHSTTLQLRHHRIAVAPPWS